MAGQLPQHRPLSPSGSREPPAAARSSPSSITTTSVRYQPHSASGSTVPQTSMNLPYLPTYLRDTPFAESWEAAYPSCTTTQTSSNMNATGNGAGGFSTVLPASRSATAKSAEISPTPSASYSAASTAYHPFGTMHANALSPQQSAGLAPSLENTHTRNEKDRQPSSVPLSAELASAANAAAAAAANCRESPPKLPTSWNAKDKCMLLDLSRDGSRVKYVGMGKNDSDAASVRSNHPIPPQCGLYYFEVEIVSKGRDGYIGVGFCTQSVALNRLPGWEPNSWGYHGDDGHSFCCSGSGKPYGPTFTTGEIVGCCINFMDKSVFYTKNGVNLGIAFHDIHLPIEASKSVLYACVGMRTPGEIVDVNFGRRPFKFSIEHYMREQRSILWDQIISIPITPESRAKSTTTSVAEATPNAGTEETEKDSALSAVLNDLIHSYLVNHGYCETAGMFAEEADNGKEEDVVMRDYSKAACERMGRASCGDHDIKTRQRIRGAIMSGDIDTAIDLTNRHYLDVLKVHDIIFFRLRCRKFVEMMLACPPDRTQNWEASKENDFDDSAGEAMDLDSDGGAPMGNDSRRSRFSLMAEAMQYGQKLQDDYKDDVREEVRQTLMETFSLLAYPDPANSVVAHLLDPAGREQVAYALNGAILASQGLPPIPPLEVVYRQAKVAVQELVRAGVGSAAFINVKNCLV